MREWPIVALGEVLTEVDRLVDVSSVDEIPYAGVRWYAEGVYARPVEDARTVKARVLNRLHTDDVTYNRMWATKAAFGVVGKDADGCLVTGDFPVFEADRGRMLPAYMSLQFVSGDFQRTASLLAVGTTERRRLKERDFLTIPIALPTLAEQRRIVAIVAASDAQVEALEAERASVRGMSARYLESRVVGVDGTAISIVDLCAKVIGGIWGSSEGESEIDVLALGPRVYSFGTTAVHTKGSPIRSFTAKQVEDRLVRDGDIVLERSGGSPEQPVGRVVVAGAGLEPCVPTDFQRLLRPKRELVDPRFLFWRLQADWNTGLSRNYSRRTTGITNLSVKEYIAREILIPDLNEQRNLVEGADAIESTVQMLTAELVALRVVRADLLAGLLSQEISVDEAVDKFVKAA